MSILSVNQLSKNYGAIKALQSVSFDVPQGSVFGILGPNGSGKTTLLSVILDILHPNAGNYNWFGQGSGKMIRRQIGSLLETPNFYHYLSAVNNLRITRSISGRGSAEDEIDVLKKVRLFERRNSRFSTYSLGMKQRLAIAAALLGDPKVLVFDEPTNGLDPVGIAEIRELITELSQQGHTIIIASHLLDEVEKVCTHVAILKSGTLLTSGHVDDVLVDEDIVEISAADLDKLKAAAVHYSENIKQLPTRILEMSMAKGSANTEAINQWFFSQGITLTHLALKKKKLETKFFELTNN